MRVADATSGGYRVNQSMNEGNDNGIRNAVPVTALLLLCFLWSLGSLRSDLMPTIFAGGLPTFEREAIHLGALAVVAWLIALVTRAAWPRGRQIWDAILIGLGLFAVPAFFGEAAKDAIPDLTRVALYSLAPVFAVRLNPISGDCRSHKAKVACWRRWAASLERWAYSLS